MNATTQWKVGELARATGTSVRTLHYYDEIGLLAPSGRTRAGHRVYDAGDVVRLQQIVSLRALGFSLEEIKETLSGAGASPLEVVRMHLQRLASEIEQKQALYTRLNQLAERLENQDQVSAGEFLQTIGAINMFEKYYTKEQLDQLAERREAFGDEAIKEVEAEWPRLIAAVRAERDRGTDPADPAVQALARRWKELIAMFTGGDPGIHKALETAWQNEPQARHQMGLDPELHDYVSRAWAADSD
jgi:MerR family transcriptional regulator, thiopeptide resistance regulator